MADKYSGHDVYQTPNVQEPSITPAWGLFIKTLAGPMFWLWKRAKAGKLDDYAWVYGSQWLANIFEGLGGKIAIEGLQHINEASEPVVFIANHMSTLETFLLPGIIRPARPVTFVVKKSLTKMPVFGPIMRSRDPVVVERKNAREDLSVVLKEGEERLKKGISVIVFPQHTRSVNFDPAKFNSIGVKLAAKAGVSVIPIALKTDAWGQGKRIKELGRIDLSLPARFRFARPMAVSARGKDEHQGITNFIQNTINSWQTSDGVNN